MGQEALEAFYEGAKVTYTSIYILGSTSSRAPRDRSNIGSTSTRAPRDMSNTRSSSTRGQRSSTIPEILHSGLLVGKHPTSITGIKIPIPIGTGWGQYLPAILNSGFQDGIQQQKQFYESARGQEAFKNTRAPRGSNIYI